MRLAFFVKGTPQARGSKRAFPFKKRDGSLGVSVTDNNKRSAGWMQTVAYEAERALQRSNWSRDRPMLLHLTFVIRRPKGHYGTGRNAGRLKDSAPAHPTTRPDATKLLRAVEDALNGVVWRDDSQVVDQRVQKRYGDTEGVDVVVQTL